MSDFTIVNHNIFWCQGAPFESPNPGDPVPFIVSGLAGLWKGFSPDVLCFQEIQSERAFNAIRTALGGEGLPTDGVFTPGNEYTQYGGAIFFRKGRVVTDSIASDARPHRMWQAVEVPFGSDNLLIVNLHLPSNRQVSPEQSALKRVNELRDMIDIVGQPDVICGDFNEQSGGGVSRFLTDRGYSDSAVVADDLSGASLDGKKRGDFIWLGERVAGRLAGYGIPQVHEMAVTYAGKKYLSDHRPVFSRLA